MMPASTLRPVNDLFVWQIFSLDSSRRRLTMHAGDAPGVYARREYSARVRVPRSGMGALTHSVACLSRENLPHTRRLFRQMHRLIDVSR
jgi:hypothetical protein